MHTPIAWFCQTARVWAKAISMIETTFSDSRRGFIFQFIESIRLPTTTHSTQYRLRAYCIDRLPDENLLNHRDTPLAHSSLAHPNLETLVREGWLVDNVKAKKNARHVHRHCEHGDESKTPGHIFNKNVNGQVTYTRRRAAWNVRRFISFT